MHLEVKVRGVHSVVVADRAHLLTSPNLLSLAHHDPVQMGIEGVCKMQPSLLDPGMTDDDDISPVCMDVSSQNDKTIPNGMHGMSECLPFSSCDDPILSKMPMSTESPGPAKSGSLRWSYR